MIPTIDYLIIAACSASFSLAYCLESSCPRSAKAVFTLLLLPAGGTIFVLQALRVLGLSVTLGLGAYPAVATKDLVFSLLGAIAIPFWLASREAVLRGFKGLIMSGCFCFGVMMLTMQAFRALGWV